MKSSSECNCTASAYVVAVMGAFLIVAGLVLVMHDYTKPAPTDQKRADERRKALAETRAADAEVLNNQNYVWQDKVKGTVRMPIDQAKEMVIQMWQKPAAARSNLIARVEKATAVPPPQQFE